MKVLTLQEAKLVQTPGEDAKSGQEEEDRERLINQDASQYRRWRRGPTTSPWTARTSSTRSRRYAGR